MGRLDYIRQYGSDNTVRSHKCALRDFFENVFGQREPLEELAERYFQEKRDYEKDIQDFLVAVKDSPPTSVRLKISAAKIFLLENNVELSQRFWRRLRGRIRGNRALTLDSVPSNEELRKIMMHLPVQGKALFLVLSSSGMRIGETLQLRMEDFEMESDPVKVNIRGEYTKTGNPRIAFISKEANEALKEWLNVREDYLKAAAGKSHLYGKNEADPRVFPFEATTAYIMWHSAIRKAGFGKRDDRTNRHKVHPHVLRKFFRTKLGTVIPVDVVEALMGHEGYLTEVYRRYSMEDLAKFYKQGEHALLVFTESGEVSRLREEIEEKNKQLQTLVNGLATENMALKEQVKKQETKIAKIETVIEEMKQMLNL